MTWRYAWRYRWKVFVETLATPTFWWTLLGIAAALLIWFFLFYLAIKQLDTSLAMQSTFCSSDEERNRHILVIVLMSPLFLVGLIGVIGEWMTVMDNRRAGRKNKYKALAVFATLLQVAALVILFALRC
ncbi:MAG: hypothetical protein PHR30_02075 [Gallionellaceae bacterium]|nr:hypothetical protein [Gallionellaceae bacterium]MDD5364102.1 hypothetical protein [Gallionellaceae bacterium]